MDPPRPRPLPPAPDPAPTVSTPGPPPAPPRAVPTPALTVVVPAHDEAGNVLVLARALGRALGGIEHETLLVDDGSLDGTRAEMLAARDEDPRIRVIGRPRRQGKTAALLAGFAHARGPVIATIDADLQDDPADVLRCLQALTTGVDAVSGWRRRRRDGPVRRASSRVGNGIRRLLLGSDVRDAGTGIRVFRRECLVAIPPFEGMHRYFGELLAMHGFRVVEVPVGHRPRGAGAVKYGIRNRALRGVCDVLAVRWMQSRVVRRDGEELS